jgi:hypothetical protein
VSAVTQKVSGSEFQVDSSFARSVGISILVIAFFAANFTLYTRFAKYISFGFEITKAEFAGISPDVITVAHDNISIRSTFSVHIEALARVSNSGPATSVKFFIESVDPNCLVQNTSVVDVEVSLQQYRSDPHQQPAELENPYYLKADETQRLRIKASIPFSLACIEESLGSLAAFSELKVVLVAEQTDHKLLRQTVNFDLTSAHKGIEEQIAAKIQHLQNSRLSGKELLEILKQYYKSSR